MNDAEFWEQKFQAERETTIRLRRELVWLTRELQVRTLEAALFNDALYADAREIQLLRRRA